MKVHKAREKWVSMRFIQKITLDYDWIAIISMFGFFLSVYYIIFGYVLVVGYKRVDRFQ